MKRSVSIDVSELFEKRPYRQCMEGLEVDGVPWIPVVGRNSFLRTAEPSPWHTHGGCVEIVYCRHGTCEYESRGKTYQLKPGRVFVSRPNESHRMLSNPKGLATYYLLFRLPEGKATEPFGEELAFVAGKLKKVPRLFDGGLRMGSHFVRLFRLIGQRFDNRPERRLRILNASLNLLLSILDAAESPMTDLGSARIGELAEEMREHPERSYPIEALVTRIGFSSSSLLSGFKAATGYSPHAYLIKCRIDRAKKLLRTGERTVTDVAGMLGFPSPQHFATQFRNATGLSPREWAAQKRS